MQTVIFTNYIAMKLQIAEMLDSTECEVPHLLPIKKQTKPVAGPSCAGEPLLPAFDHVYEVEVLFL